MKIRNFGLVCKATNTTSNEVQVSYYKDTNSTADESFALIPHESGRRLAHPVHQMGKEGPAVFHSFKMEMTTDDETIGFEPLFIKAFYKCVREKLL